MTSVREMLSPLDASESPEDRVSDANRERADVPWQKSLASAIRSVTELLNRLQLPESLIPSANAGAELFPIVVPESFLNRMETGNLEDPLLQQVLPVVDETVSMPGFSLDPVEDQNSKRSPGILQKYQGRVLMMATGTCAVHCRYCFRRHYPYQQEPSSLEQWQPALETIANDASVHEVILSGGDPLILGDSKLSQLVQSLGEIPHLKRLRIHSRLPIVLPNRVNEELLTTLKEMRLQTIMVVHANHGNELVNDCATALRKLVAAGIPTLNQAVLLRGVNDTADAMVDLCERSVNIGVMPYYLHQLDRVQGAAHFEVPVARGLEIIEELRKRLPGYAVPKFVQEIPAEASKTPITNHVQVRRASE